MRKGYKDVMWKPSEGEENTPKYRIYLSDALGLGHNTWTAKIDCFAKTTLFGGADGADHGGSNAEPNPAPHFYEVTNVIRFGFGTQVITPVTKEKDFLPVVNENIHEYGFEHPKAMKYVGIPSQAYSIHIHISPVANRMVEVKSSTLLMSGSKPASWVGTTTFIHQEFLLRNGQAWGLQKSFFLGKCKHLWKKNADNQCSTFWPLARFGTT